MICDTAHISCSSKVKYYQGCAVRGRETARLYFSGIEIWLVFPTETNAFLMPFNALSVVWCALGVWKRFQLIWSHFSCQLHILKGKYCIRNQSQRFGSPKYKRKKKRGCFFLSVVLCASFYFWNIHSATTSQWRGIKCCKCCWQHLNSRHQNFS